MLSIGTSVYLCMNIRIFAPGPSSTDPILQLEPAWIVGLYGKYIRRFVYQPDDYKHNYVSHMCVALTGIYVTLLHVQLELHQRSSIAQQM